MGPKNVTVVYRWPLYGGPEIFNETLTYFTINYRY